MFELNAHVEVMKYTGDVPFSTLAAAQQFVAHYNDNAGQYHKYRMGRLAAIRKTDHKFIGWCGLKYHEDQDAVDLGYRLLRE